MARTPPTPPTPDSGEPAAQLLRLRERFVGGLPARAAALQDATAAWSDSASPQAGDAAREALSAVLHRLAGAAGLHGFGALCDEARRLEDAVRAAGPVPGASLLAALASLRATLERPGALCGSDGD